MTRSLFDLIKAHQRAVAAIHNSPEPESFNDPRREEFEEELAARLDDEYDALLALIAEVPQRPIEARAVIEHLTAHASEMDQKETPEIPYSCYWELVGYYLPTLLRSPLLAPSNDDGDAYDGAAA